MAPPTLTDDDDLLSYQVLQIQANASKRKQMRRHDYQ